MFRPAARPLAALALVALLGGLGAGCGRDRDRGDGGDVGVKDRAGPPPPAASPAYPATATKNTTRVATAAGAETAAAVARIVFPGGGRGQRPPAVALADADDWRAALVGAVLMAPPLRAPLLFTDGGETPPVTAAALEALRPTGAARANGAQAIRLGTAGTPPGGLRTTSIAGSDPFTLAANVDDYRSRVAGRRSARVLVASAEAPQYAMPAAAWAAKAGDPVLLTARDELPPATRTAIRAHGRPRIYLLGPPAAVAPAVERQLSRLGTVTRIAGDDPASSAVEFARFVDGAFGWGIVDPGHGLVFADPGRPTDAGAAAPLSSSGTYGPLLLLAEDGGLPRAVREYLLDIRPGYSSDPVRGVYNHGWVVGAPDVVPVAVQAEIDGLLEIAEVPPPKPDDQDAQP